MTVINLNQGDFQSKTILDTDGICSSIYSGECRYGGGEIYILDKREKEDMKEDGYILFEPRSQDGVPRIHDKVSPTLNTAQGGQRQPCIVKENMMEDNNAVVRRLTTRECERLQNFPDGWCDIGEWIDSKGKKHKDADAPKYKALGNSIALPFWQFLANNMVKELKEDGVDNPTMGSLFDGISGFPLVFKRSGCEPIWASEIEEYAIAVEKKHFGNEETGEKGDIEKYI